LATNTSSLSCDPLQWHIEIAHFLPNVPIILVGLKSDLRDERRCRELLQTQGLTPVTYEKGRETATEIEAVYMECSSKTGEGGEEIFNSAIVLAVGSGASSPTSPSGTSDNVRMKTFKAKSNGPIAEDRKRYEGMLDIAKKKRRLQRPKCRTV